MKKWTSGMKLTIGSRSGTTIVWFLIHSEIRWYFNQKFWFSVSHFVNRRNKFNIYPSLGVVRMMFHLVHVMVRMLLLLHCRVLKNIRLQQTYLASVSRYYYYWMIVAYLPIYTRKTEIPVCPPSMMGCCQEEECGFSSWMMISSHSYRWWETMRNEETRILDSGYPPLMIAIHTCAGWRYIAWYCCCCCCCIAGCCKINNFVF